MLDIQPWIDKLKELVPDTLYDVEGLDDFAELPESRRSLQCWVAPAGDHAQGDNISAVLTEGVVIVVDYKRHSTSRGEDAALTLKQLWDSVTQHFVADYWVPNDEIDPPLLYRTTDMDLMGKGKSATTRMFIRYDVQRHVRPDLSDRVCIS